MNIRDIYENYDEDNRLNQTKASSIEYHTTMKYIEKYLFEGAKILEIGAGTGAYSVALAKDGYPVTAIELVKYNIEIMKTKVYDTTPLEIIEANALDLSAIGDNVYDLVLCFGPLYHLSAIEDKKRVIREASRVCKHDGILFFAYLSNDMVIVTEAMKDPDFLILNDYDHATFRVVDEPFCFMTVEQMERLMMEFPLEFLHHVGVDGFAELLKDQINRMSDGQYLQWLRFNEYMCEKEHGLSYSNHLLYITRKYE